ncbi:MAG: SAM-dependent methyltransferase [Eubacterium sp.]|nr:SAM-dependent methyltransferase [Eubacterium sp.]
MKELGERLQAIVDMVRPDQRVADIGCDHAYVSLELARKKNCTVLAMDIGDGPLKIAEENIRAAAEQDGKYSKAAGTATANESGSETANGTTKESNGETGDAAANEPNGENGNDASEKPNGETGFGTTEEPASSSDGDQTGGPDWINRITLRKSDGLAGLSRGEADALVIAGMGGHLIIDILHNGADKLRSGMQLVLSPQSDLRLVRYELRKMNIFITEEKCLSEEGKWYFILNCKVGMNLPAPVSDEEAKQYMMYGKYLPEHPSDAFREFLVWEARGLEDLLKSLAGQKTPAARARSGTIRRQLEENRYIQSLIG